MIENTFKSYSRDEQDELLSKFLINSWSYSKVTAFARNEKDFERRYVYHEQSKRSASSIAGNAYHEALKTYFVEWSQGIELNLLRLQEIAFDYIDDVPANDWKIQKTTPTIEECKISAVKSVTALLDNFYQERGVYTEELESVIGAELHVEEWVVVNGVDIPLPCHGDIDLVIRTKEGKVVIIDHKSKRAFTDDNELQFVAAKQAMTYVITFEARTGMTVDEVWFVENKISKNKDKSAQLKKFRIILNEDTRRLYEALLYEPLKRMLEAVSDPDYVYTINDSDTLCERAELYEFWAKTLIAEVDDFNIPENKKEIIAHRQKKIRDAESGQLSPKTISEFKKRAATFITFNYNNSDMTNGEKIEHVLRTFGMIVKVAHTIEGFSSNTYLLEVSAGVKIANIVKYSLDIASALNVSSVRIPDNLFVYEDQSYLAIEANKKRTEDLLWDEGYLKGHKIPIGLDNFRNQINWDLDSHGTPHVLVCGATGSGKSVCVKSTICYALAAGVKKIIIFDPKYEFNDFDLYPECYVYNEIEFIEDQMKQLVANMQERVKTGHKELTLVIFDEFADAVASSRQGNALKVKVNGEVHMEKSLEENLKMLLQKGRSSGFRIMAATQRASTKVITGDAKVNFPVQVCFRVPKEVDSKVVLDEGGAETLSGCGDGLIKSPDYPNVVRFQGFFKP